MDRIELSNLSRQFLFRRKHVGKPKSLSAAEAGAEMNPAVKDAVRVHEVRVGPDTENVFTDQYWKKLDVVINGMVHGLGLGLALPCPASFPTRCIW
jgi:ubiquitin-activating enzyme E1